jgi:hypothetical protein
MRDRPIATTIGAEHARHCLPLRAPSLARALECERTIAGASAFTSYGHIAGYAFGSNVPGADIGRSLNHLVGGREQLVRDGHPQ